MASAPTGRCGTESRPSPPAPTGSRYSTGDGGSQGWTDVGDVGGESEGEREGERERDRGRDGYRERHVT